MKASSGSEKVVKAILRYKPELSPHDDGASLILEPDLPSEPYLLAADDYRVVIDDKFEFLVHHIEMTDRGDLACPIKVAEVNECKLGRNQFVKFEAACGRASHSLPAK